MCREFHALPYSGGLYEQNHLWVRTTQAVLSAQAEAEKNRNNKKQQQGKKQR